MKPSSGEPSTPATDSAEPNSTESTSRTTSSGSEAASRAVNDRTSKNFSVRAGAFDQAQEAEELAKTLRSRGFVSAYTEKSLSETGNPRFLVMLGPWVDRESAIRTMNELRNQGLSNVVIIGQP
jgi:cell division septation protein DedD